MRFASDLTEKPDKSAEISSQAFPLITFLSLFITKIMKIGILFFTVLSLMFYNCQKNDSTINSENKPILQTENMNPQTNPTKKFDDLEITYKINLEKNSSLNIAYTIKNTGKDNYIVFNQGHTNRQETDATYIEELADGTVEFSQKAFSKPAGVMCPNSLVPISSRGAILKAGAELNGQAAVNFPLKSFTPYDFCIPPKPIDDNAAQAKFCLGVAKTANAEVKIDEKGNVNGVNAFVSNQNILCSDSINLK